MNITVKKEFEEALKEQLHKSGVDYEEKNLLFTTPKFNSGFELTTTISLLIGTAAFWTALASVLKEVIKKTPVEIEYHDSLGKTIKIKAESLSDIDNIMEKLSELSDNSKKNENNTK